MRDFALEAIEREPCSALEVVRAADAAARGHVATRIAAKLGAAGVRSDTQVVGYDAQGGMYAARMPFAAMRHVADQLGCTAAEVEDVVSYYTMFYTRPVGKYVLNVCRTLSCALLGAERVTEALSEKLGIKPGETDPTGTFTLIEVECLGACDRAPVVMVNDDWHEGLTPEQCAQFIDDVRAKGTAAFTGCHLKKERA